MQKKTLPFEISELPRTGKRRSASALADQYIETKQLVPLIEDYLAYCQVQCHSPKTIEKRKCLLARLEWFLHDRSFGHCGVTELRRFFGYLPNSHNAPAGRWGKGLGKQWTTPMRPITIKTYWLTFAAFFNWLVEEDFLDDSPMKGVPCIEARPDQIEHFSEDQIKALLRASEDTSHPKRDYAIIRLLLSTGMRVGELCSLKVGDVDLTGRTVRVHGKGDKYRTLGFGLKARKALISYLQEGDMDISDALFPADRGRNTDDALTTRGVLSVVKRIGKRAKITNVRVSPHTFRHTYAYQFLKGKGGTFPLMHSLGHTSLTMTQNYVKMADADVVQNMKDFTPDDRF